MKLPGILMYCVHWGKSNCTRPVLMSVLDSFFGKCPRERARGDGRGRKKKEKNTRKEKEAKRSNKFTRSEWTRGPRKCDSAVQVPGFPKCDCAFLFPRKEAFTGNWIMWADKYTWWWAQALDWTGLEEGKKSRQRASVDKVSLPRTGPRWSGPVGALSLNELMRIRPNHFFNSTFI